MIRSHRLAFFAALLLVSAGLGGCSAAASAPGRALSENAGTVRVPLTTLGSRTMTPYKLGPATFEIDGAPGAPFQPLTVSADGEQSTLEIPLDPGSYSVSLQTGWTLQQGTPEPGGASTEWSPVSATLTSPNPQTFSIEPYQATDVTFAFHLGVSQVNLGISVDEGPPPIPPGYDGVIWRASPNDGWQVSYGPGGAAGACCFSSPAEAQGAYPNLRLFVVQ